MRNISYVDLSLDQLGHVRLKDRSLRLVTYAGQSLLALGAIDDVEFFDAEEIIRGLHGGQQEWDGPLPKPVAVPVLDEFDGHEQNLLREIVLGAPTAEYRIMLTEAPRDVIVARAASLGFIINGAKYVKELEASVRLKTQAENRARHLADKAQDLAQGFMVKPADDSVAPVLGVVRKCDPATYERIVRGTGGYSPASSRIRWPFNTMRVGDEIFIDAKLARKAQTAAHVYAARANWTFRTSLDCITKVLRVIRTEDRPGTIPQATKGE